MQFYELTITSLLQKDIPYNEANQAIATCINRAMLPDPELSQRHEQKGYKFYVFNSFYPIEPDKLYKMGRIYIFKLRTLRQELAEKLRDLLPSAKNDSFKILAVQLETQRRRHISELYTVTPALATINGKHWVKGDDFDLLMRRMQDNLEKKYRDFYGEEIKPDGSFIQQIEVINHKPLCYKYKNTSLLANKFRILVNDDEVSQKLAFVALGAGLLEKNSGIGCGFCSAR